MTPLRIVKVMVVVVGEDRHLRLIHPIGGHSRRLSETGKSVSR